MIGSLPTSLEINGKEYKLRTDYRNILFIFEALADTELSDNEKLYVMLYRMFEDFDSLPGKDYAEAYEKVSKFISCNSSSEDKKNPQLLDWEKDEQLIFPAINAVAGFEVRAVEYMHWWTFLGFLQSVDNESLWSFVLSIRQKQAKGKKLEKYEREFLNNNRELCSIQRKVNPKKAEDDLEALFKQLTEGGSDNG